jgi:class 3 adenylate cyclase/tetratricopeptide (TPR) repeat protein
VQAVCLACGTENRVGRKFCGQCGASLTAACPTCGATTEPGDLFCGDCGAQLERAEGALTQTPASTAVVPPAASRPEISMPVSERRVCSVLFADLVGFTPLSESRDPEEVRELLSAYFDAARTVITRYGGVVEKFIGDAVMAVWGTPVAVEGDAERAVRAGLDLVAAVALLGEEVGAPGLQARAGVVTGEIAVTVGLVGQGVAGDAVNTAARVQTAASPGEVWVDEATHRLARAAVGFTDTGEHTLKGKTDPMRLWAATRVLSGIGGAQRVDGLEAPLLGRDAELRTIKELFHATAERRTPRLVVVSGPAGVGKSRLGWEFEKYIDGLAGSVKWHRGRCLSYGDGVAFWALAAIVRQRLGIAEEDAANVAASKLAEGLSTYVKDPEERGYVAARLSRLLGVAVDGDPGAVLGREELFAGWRLFFERLSATEPVVLMVEDVQYADAGLLDFLDHLADWARDVPIFVLAFARPELTQSRPGWGLGRNRTTLTIDPLDAASMDRVVEALVPGMPVAARAAITGQAQGIPLFAVETIRALIDRDIVVPIGGEYRLVGDVGSLAVPDSLRGLLAARLDALDADLRALVADAAVLGTSFPIEALFAVSQRGEEDVRTALAELLRREVLEVSADPLSPQRGNYGFTQNLLRQVAYDTLSRRDRKARHLTVAGHLRATFAGDGDEVIDVIARHYQDALAAVPGDPDTEDLRAEAIAALVRAAERASRSGAPVSSARSYATAAALTTDSARPDATVAAAGLWERAAAAGVLAGDFDTGIEHAARAAALYTQLDQPRAAARAQTVAAKALRLARRHSEARELLADIVTVLRPDPDQDTVTALSELAAIEIFTGGSDGDRLADEALALGQALDVDRSLLAALFSIRGIAAGFASRRDEAVANLQYAVQLAENAGDAAGWGRALANVSAMLLTLDAPAAAAAARTAVEHSRRVGAAGQLAVAVVNLATALQFSGDWDGAASAVTDGARADGIDGDADVTYVHAVLLALRGDVHEAGRVADASGFRTAEDPQDRGFAAVLDALIAVAVDRQAEALAHARDALALADAIGMHHEVVVWSWPVAARAAYAMGDEDATAELLALLDAHPIGHLPPLLRAERDLARARQSGARGEHDADARFADAIAALRRLTSPFNLAHGLLDHADHLTNSGDPARATPLIEEARAIAERLLAQPLLQRAERAGRALDSNQPLESFVADPSNA